MCDQYAVTVTNVGSSPSSGVVTIVDTLPRGVEVVRVHGEDVETREAARLCRRCCHDVYVWGE